MAQRIGQTHFRLRRTDPPTKIVWGEQLLAGTVARFLKSIHPSPTATLFVCDRKVYRLHRKQLDALRPKHSPLILLAATERRKSEQTAHQLLRWLHANFADRRALVVAIGGGVITDLVGYVASIYMRGVRYISVPTTLVGMVDAAIGGKTAINFAETKNIVGTYHAPLQIVSDFEFLATLHDSQIRDGVVEALKIFAVADRRAWNRHAAGVAQRNPHAAVSDMIADAIRLKAKIVTRDPFENDLRRILNFGHTTGHAYEAITGHSHGRSVAYGILVALELSRRYAGLPERDYAQVAVAIRAVYPSFDYRGRNTDLLWSKVLHDKKRLGREIPFVLLERTGQHAIRSIDYRQFAAAVAAVWEPVA